MATATKKLSISERIVDSKRHTVGYVVNGTALTRKRAIEIANLGWVDGVRVVAGSNGRATLVGTDARLYDLPIRVVSK